MPHRGCSARPAAMHAEAFQQWAAGKIPVVVMDDHGIYPGPAGRRQTGSSLALLMTGWRRYQCCGSTKRVKPWPSIAPDGDAPFAEFLQDLGFQGPAPRPEDSQDPRE